MLMHCGRKKENLSEKLLVKGFPYQITCFVRSVYKNIDTYIYLLIFLTCLGSSIGVMFFWGWFMFLLAPTDCAPAVGPPETKTV